MEDIEKKRVRGFKVKEAADVLRVSVRSVWRLIKESKIKVIRIGRAVRIDAESLEAFIAQGGEK